MKTFKQFLDESSLSRVVSKSKKGGTAILSGSRADKSPKENKARAKQLDKDIRGKGLGGATKATLFLSPKPPFLVAVKPAVPFFF